MYLDLFRAIEERRLIQIHYGRYYRVIEPYLFGSDTRGEDVLRGYQVAGYDGLQCDIGWKWFNTCQISNVVILSAQFERDRTGAPMPQGAMQRIYCQVSS